MPRPEGHTPRFPALSARLAAEDELVFGQYGVQAADPSGCASGVAALEDILDLPDGPSFRDRGWFADPAGAHNQVVLAYWRDPVAHRRWASSDAVTAFWDSRPLDGEVGHWREESTLRAVDMETLHTHPVEAVPTAGVSQHLPLEPTDTHDYWGAAHDRIPRAAAGEVAPELTAFEPVTTETRGRRLVRVAPADVCMIRSAQDWSSSTTFRTSFLEDVQPVKSAGMDYLNATPETGCIVAREINECDRGGNPLDKASTIAWFASLDHLSAWAKSHKTHLKIYASFFQMVAARPDDLLDVAFWHEVSVPTAGNVRAEYVNCHPATGFLRVAESAARV